VIYQSQLDISNMIPSEINKGQPWCRLDQSGQRGQAEMAKQD
jgi:hypothetical protein